MNDQFDQWLRENFPGPKPSEFRAETQLAILKERLRVRAEERRRKRIRRTMILVPVLVLTGLVGSVVELGSDGFDHDREIVEGISGEVVKTGFREDAINHPVGTPEGEVIDLEMQVAMSYGPVIEVEGWSIEGEVIWSLSREYSASGELQVVSQFSKQPPSKPTMTFFSFLAEEWDEAKSQITSGEIVPKGEKLVLIDGNSYSLTYWIIGSSKYGELIYYFGSISH